MIYPDGFNFSTTDSFQATNRFKVSTITGILLDVSGSMRHSISDGVEEQGGPWIKSIFTVIDDLLKHDLSSENQVFAIGFGSNCDSKIFDILQTLDLFSNQGPAHYRTIEAVFKELKNFGARYIRQWVDPYKLICELKEYQAKIILHNLRHDSNFGFCFVRDCLPPACREMTDPSAKFTQSAFVLAASKFRQATPSEIKIATEKAMSYIRSDGSLLKGAITKELSLYNAKDASRVIHGCVDERGITTQRAQEYLELIEPFIYGVTPLFEALRTSIDLYPKLPDNVETDVFQRLLFVVSDGLPTDTGNLDTIKSEVNNERGVKVVGCYISKSRSIMALRLYSDSEQQWENGAKFMFDLSSFIPASTVTRAIFNQHGWEVDMMNNETRLFMHVNHPDHLKDACELARNAVYCQDALLDLLVSVDLDLYINRKNADAVVYDQGDVGTCYAHAAATVVHLATHRILGRDGGYPDFEQLRDDMIRRHGRHGANTQSVLQEVCPQYRLHCSTDGDFVPVQRAMKAIAEKRPVVAKFRLTKDEWTVFKRFYQNHPKGILRKADLNRVRYPSSEQSGHAVVLTSYNREYLYLMNSWGDKWANNGFFKVENADVLGLDFIDVYWNEDDLSTGEIEYYHKHGSDVANRLMTSLRALQIATFTCPLCGVTSKAKEFRGTLLNALCPSCKREFSSKDGNGNILVLNMYLTSLRT